MERPRFRGPPGANASAATPNSLRSQIDSIRWLPIGAFLTAFLAVPLRQLHGLAMMPGDIGDARLNNYFLENIYKVVTGASGSLWNLGFFAPFPMVIGFSDNLFGSAPVYFLARLLTGEPDTAFQIWFLFGYIVNFGATYYALRRLGSTRLGATIGALVFTFALPTTAQAMHAQLHYRFGIPLAATFLVLFLETKDFGKLASACAWLVWQFYCSIYMGFFTLLLLGAGCAAYFGYRWLATSETVRDTLRAFVAGWRSQHASGKVRVLASLTALAAAMLVLFYPYLQASRLYHVRRWWSEISTMLPRPQSYLLSDQSYFWSFPSASFFADIPMRHEQQMFIGALPLLLALTGFFLTVRGKGRERKALLVLAGGLLGVVAVTLSVGGYSLWYFVHAAPLASAIRAMSRLDQVLLFPLGFLCALAVDGLGRWRGATAFLAFAAMPLIILEQSATTMNVSAKQVWRDRLEAADTRILETKRVQNERDPLLFFAQTIGAPFDHDAQEIDAMWASLRRGYSTMNGYSGSSPPGYSPQFGSDCEEAPKRILSYLAFTNRFGDVSAYHRLMDRVVPIGFGDCEPGWTSAPPQFTRSAREYTADEVRNVAVSLVRRTDVNGRAIVRLKLENRGDGAIAAQSAVFRPLRLGWRFVDRSGNAVTGWRMRKELNSDIPAHGELTMSIIVDPPSGAQAVQVSLIQEAVFAAHDIGVPPLTIPLD